ncbi:uncharacterized protein LOC126701953 isoform X4 [Quercus robur]|uniref:uncharacterized protein LOC126701953 isoform X4 n=1 Tax=Quercus robur TaxID=38942 RepID=UPI0021635EE9|nr:uncharacterized protein LOC126701953 isoform X4 [Quercus robur]
MGVLFSVPWKKKTPAKRRVGERIRCPKLEPCIFIANSAPIWDMQTLQRHEQQVQKLVKMGFDEADVRSALEYGNEISAIKMLRFAECAWAGNDTNTKLWQPDEQQVQKLVEMGFAEAAVGSALEAVNGDEILAIKMLCFEECGPAGIDTYRKLWQPDEQQVQKLAEMGFAEAAVRSALEAVNGDEILAIKMLRFADCGPAGIETYRKLWQPDEQRVQKLVEMGFAEAAVRCSLEAVNGDEILAIKMLRFAECARAGNDTNTKLWQPDEQQVQKYMEMGFAEAAVRSALEAVNGNEILAIKMLCFAECGPAGIDTYRKLWQPDEQRVQKLVEMGFTKAAVRSALEAINGDEILAIKMLRFAECVRAGNDTTTKLWQPDEQRVQKLVEMGFVEDAVRSALEAVNGDETLAVKMLRFAECARVGNDTNTKLWQPDEQQVQKLVEMGFAEATMRSALEAVNGDEILAIKMLRFAEFGPARINTYRKLWRPDEQRVQKLAEMGFAEAVVRSALEAVNGDEILAIKMLRFAQFARAGNSTNTKPDEQRVQKLVEMGFAEAAVRSALEAVNGVEILAIKMLRFAECARAGNDTNTKLWQPDEQQVQKLVEKCCDDAAGRSAMEAPVRSALEAVNGDEKYAITMLLFAARVQSSNDIKTKEVQNLVAVEVLLMLFIICLFFIFLLNSEAVNGDEILAFKLMK